MVDLLAQAARDPAALAITKTRYRTNRHSPTVGWLSSAAWHPHQNLKREPKRWAKIFAD